MASKVNSLLLLKDHLKRKRFFYDLLWKVLQKGLLYIKASWPILKCWENVGIENQYSMGHQGKYPVYPVLPTVNTTFDDLKLLELYCTDL